MFNNLYITRYYLCNHKVKPQNKDTAINVLRQPCVTFHILGLWL